MDTLQMFDNGLQSTDVMNPSHRRLTSFYMLVENRKDRWRRSLFNWRKCSEVAQAMSYILPDFRFTDNPPITYLHQLLTPTFARALLFATLPAYSLTGKRVGGGM